MSNDTQRMQDIQNALVAHIQTQLTSDEDFEIERHNNKTNKNKFMPTSPSTKSSCMSIWSRKT